MLSSSTLRPLSLSKSGSKALSAKKKGSSTESTRTVLEVCACAVRVHGKAPVAAVTAAADPVCRRERLVNKADASCGMFGSSNESLRQHQKRRRRDGMIENRITGRVLICLKLTQT